MCSDQGGYRKEDKGLRRDRGKKAGKSSGGGRGRNGRKEQSQEGMGAGQGQQARSTKKQVKMKDGIKNEL